MAATVAVMIATPLTAGHAERIAAVDGRVELLFEPALLPPALWPGDIVGDPDFTRDAAGERRWTDLIARAEVLFGIPGSSGRGLAEAVQAGSRLRWVQARNAGAGEQVGDAAAIAPEELARVVVTTASGVHAGPLAEFCMLGLLAFAKRLPELQAAQAARRWPEQEEFVDELRGSTVLVVGLGAIGREVARLARAFGMRVLAVKRDPSGEAPEADEVHPPQRLPHLAARADAIVVTLPLTETTRKLIDAETLASIKSGATFVNVGRGGVVDEAALVDALRDGRLRGALLDVFEREPLPPDSPLWTLPNVIVSPHSAGLVPAEEERVVELFRDNLRRYLHGEPLRNRVDVRALY